VGRTIAGNDFDERLRLRGQHAWSMQVKKTNDDRHDEQMDAAVISHDATSVRIAFQEVCRTPRCPLLSRAPLAATRSGPWNCSPPACQDRFRALESPSASATPTR